MSTKVEQEVLKKVRTVLMVLIVIWMIVVFTFSQQNGESSGGLSHKLALLLFHTETAAEFMEPVLRKGAHMTEYAIGAMLVYGYCLTYQKMEDKKRWIFSEGFIMLYAITDELHQLFINGRSGNFIDVLIDSVGGVIGIAVVYFAIKLAQSTEYAMKHPEEAQAQREALQAQRDAREAEKIARKKERKVFKNKNK